MHVGSRLRIFGPTAVVGLVTVLGVLLSSIWPQETRVSRSFEEKSTPSTVVLDLLRPPCLLRARRGSGSKRSRQRHK